MQIVYNNITYECSEDYSSWDATGHDLSSEQGMSGIVIFSSCFSHEQVDSHCFPEDMTGTTFIKCNLDNCYIPSGNTILDCSTRRFKAQEDGQDWLVDEFNNPIKLLNS